MIILVPGIYPKRDMLDMDYGTDALPTTKVDIIINNPYGYGVPSYRISKIKIETSNSFYYKIEEI